MLGVSIHAPVKVRQKKTFSLAVKRCFNSRTREGATWKCNWRRCFYRCFNSRTREGATPLFAINENSTGVSIHAPVKVRPLFCSPFGYSFLVSIHAPVKVRHRFW